MDIHAFVYACLAIYCSRNKVFMRHPLCAGTEGIEMTKISERPHPPHFVFCPHHSAKTTSYSSSKASRGTKPGSLFFLFIKKIS